MNGAHDMGGTMGFGPIETQGGDRVVFHHRWQGRAFALNRAMGVIVRWNSDQRRFAIENRSPADYLGMSYYKRNFIGLVDRLLAAGLVAVDELAAGRSLRPGRAVERILTPAVAASATSPNTRFDRPVTAPATFAVGDKVRARNINPTGHTRLPRYVRGHVGMIESVRGAHIYPDSNAHGRGEDPRWLYCVVFTGREIWGDAADPKLTVSVEAWEPYLEPL